MIKNILFDYAGVLASIDFLGYCTECGGDAVRGAYLRENVLRSKIWADYDCGLYSADDTAARFEKVLDPSFCAAMRDIVYRLDRAFCQNDDMLPVLESLKKQGYRMFLLSNFPKEIYDAVSKKTPILSLLDDCIVSCDIKMLKPDPDIYNYAVKKYGLDPKETLFTDDYESNVIGAREFGLNSITFTTADAFVTALTEYGISV